jgi:hypothetical protein
MSNEDVKFKVGAEDTGVEATMAKVQASVEKSVANIKTSLESLNGAFSKIQGAFIAFTAVLAGGEAFKAAVEATVNMAKESQLLGRQLGISATDASILKVALASSFATQEQWSAGASKITQTLAKNEGAFKALGVATRDSNGDLRNAQDVQLDVNAKLMEFTEGSARNVEAVKIYGRSWKEIEPTFRINAEAIKEATARAQALGIVVGQESVAQSNAYRSAMVGVHETLEGISVVIGNALIPILTSMGEWFSEHGPAVINAFKAALYSLGSLFITDKEIINVFCDVVAGEFKVMTAAVVMSAHLIDRALHWDWSGVKAQWEAGTQNIAKASKAMADSIKGDMAAAAKSRDELFEKLAGNQTAIKKPTGGKGSGPEAEDLAALQAAFQAEKAAWDENNRQHGQFIEYSKQQEVEYWQNILATKKLAQKDATKVHEDINKLLYAIDKQGYEDELSGLKAQEAKYKNNLQAKLEIAQEYAAKIAAAEGTNSPAANRAQAEVMAIEREIAAQKIELAKITQDALDKVAIGAIDKEEGLAKIRLVRGEITSQQLIAQQRQFEAQKLAIIIAGIDAQIAAAQKNPEENMKLIEQLNAQKLAATTKYDAQITALSIKAATDEQKTWDTLFKTMQSGFSNVFTNFLNGNKSLTQSLRAMTSSVAASFEQMVAKNISQLLMQAAVGKTIKLKELMGSAGVAAGNAYKAIVGIPYVGPFLAPAAAAVAYAGVLAFGGGISAEGGYDIPAGVNPVVQTHQREMILPENIADKVRGMSDRSGSTNVTFPGKDLGNHFLMHKDDLAVAIRTLVRNGQVSL